MLAFSYFFFNFFRNLTKHLKKGRDTCRSNRYECKNVAYKYKFNLLFGKS